MEYKFKSYIQRPNINMTADGVSVFYRTEGDIRYRDEQFKMIISSTGYPSEFIELLIISIADCFKSEIVKDSKLRLPHVEGIVDISDILKIAGYYEACANWYIPYNLLDDELYFTNGSYLMLENRKIMAKIQVPSEPNFKLEDKDVFQIKIDTVEPSKEIFAEVILKALILSRCKQSNRYWPVIRIKDCKTMPRYVQQLFSFDYYQTGKNDDYILFEKM